MATSATVYIVGTGSDTSGTVFSNDANNDKNIDFNCEIKKTSIGGDCTEHYDGFIHKMYVYNLQLTATPSDPTSDIFWSVKLENDGNLEDGNNRPATFTPPDCGNQKTCNFNIIIGKPDPPNSNKEPTYTITARFTANKPPTISITNPLNEAIFNEPATFSITATASDSDGSIKRVEFYNGATKISEDTSDPYESSSLTELKIGSYILTAKAIDNKDASTTSNPITITVVDKYCVGECTYIKTDIENCNKEGKQEITLTTGNGCRESNECPKTKTILVPCEKRVVSLPFFNFAQFIATIFLTITIYLYLLISKKKHPMINIVSKTTC